MYFQRRAPGLAKQIRETFGPDAIRVAKNHCKFALLKAGAWRLVIQTSMNVNYNPRFENFALAHDPELWDFYDAILNEIWRRQKREIAHARPGDIVRHWSAEL